MVPIHDTDIAEERWSQGEWQHYELWEKVEVRLRRRKWIWILSAAMVFVLLSAVPILMERWPKWVGLAAVRRLAQEVNRIKRDAGVEHAAFRIRFDGDGSLRYSVEKAFGCQDPGVSVVRTGSLVAESRLSDYRLMRGGSGLVDSFCYDYLAGSEAVLRGESVVGFGVMPAKDLTAPEGRVDRASVILLSGPSAEISFE